MYMLLRLLQDNFGLWGRRKTAINQANFLRTLMNFRASSFFGSSEKKRSSKRKPKLRCKIFETFTACRRNNRTQGRRKCEVCANLESYLQEIPLNILYKFTFSLLILILAQTIQIYHKHVLVIVPKVNKGYDTLDTCPFRRMLLRSVRALARFPHPPHTLQMSLS